MDGIRTPDKCNIQNSAPIHLLNHACMHIALECVCFVFILTPHLWLEREQGSFSFEPWSILRGKNLV